MANVSGFGRPFGWATDWRLHHDLFFVALDFLDASTNWHFGIGADHLADARTTAAASGGIGLERLFVIGLGAEPYGIRLHDFGARSVQLARDNGRGLRGAFIGVGLCSTRQCRAASDFRFAVAEI